LPSYGIYSGFELCENVPLHPGSEEYLDSEKYQLRPRNYDAPGNINADIERLNTIRRAHPALHRYRNLTFHRSENESVLFYRKAGHPTLTQWVGGRQQPIPPKIAASIALPAAPGANDILVVVNTDPQHTQETMVHVPINEMGIDQEQPYVVEDLLTGVRYTWRGVRNYVRLDPAVEPGHLFLVHPGAKRVEQPASAP
jgi:starch synthase (maltosyl-transferring)